MARPSRCRRICLEPEYDRFAPWGLREREEVLLTVDEFEAIRLIDYEKRTHAQCAQQMGISRTTVTEMYERARGKLADCIVNGKTLRISGGNYALCDGSAWPCCGKKCGRARRFAPQQGPIGKEVNHMKLAVTYENGNVFPHFGHTEQFKLYEVEDGKITGSEVVDTNGSGHGALAGFLMQHGVNTLICGGIGGGAQAALTEAGIKLYGGVSGDADAAVNALLSDNLGYDPNVHCSHHDHEHGEGGHTCGNHGCGSHSCH